MKETMSKRDIAKFHNYLKEDISMDKISKGMGISKKTLAKFTPEAIKKVKDQQAKDAGKKPEENKSN